MVFLIVDIIDLSYKVRDIVKNKGSGAARVLRGKANEYEAILKDKTINKMILYFFR